MVSLYTTSINSEYVLNADMEFCKRSVFLIVGFRIPCGNNWLQYFRRELLRPSSGPLRDVQTASAILHPPYE